jgi:acetyl-CoA carboxylase biotin carboxyl carrier protein
MKLSEIQDLIKFVARSGVTEVEIEQANFKITIKADNRKGKADAYAMPQMQMPMQAMPMAPAPMPVAQVAAPPAPAPAAAPPAEPARQDNSKYIAIKSPMIGTFYRAPGPDKPPFASVGDEVKPGKVICIIEAMKLFNEIECEVSGKIVKVLVDDASPVEYDQPLFLVDPS